MHISDKRTIEEGEHACTGDAQNLIPEGVEGKLAVHEALKLLSTNQTEPATAHSYDTATVDTTWLQWYIRTRDLQEHSLQSTGARLLCGVSATVTPSQWLCQT
jgi:hypothetical protein